MCAEVSSFQAAVFGLQAEINGASLLLATPLHCVTADTGGHGVMCLRYEIRSRRRLSATAGMSSSSGGG